MPQRLVKLTSYQVVNSVAALAGAEVAADIRTAEALEPDERPFPPLADEPYFSQSDFFLRDRAAEAVGKNALDEFADVTGCGDAPTDECGQTFLTSFAEKAYRRPLAEPERDSLLTAYAEFKMAGATVPEAVQHGVWAVLDSPYFLYRTEFGDGDAEGPELSLAPHEMASQLSYFLTDGPPDDELLAAADHDELRSVEDIGVHVRRLLESPSARTNLVLAMASHFALPQVSGTVLAPSLVPGLDVTPGLLSAMRREGDLFLEHTLFGGSLEDLLTSRQTYVNELLATSVYGVPPPSRDLDGEGFGLVELPPERAGMLTSAVFLTSLSPPHGTSIVDRGIALGARVVCQLIPPFPEGILDPALIEEQASWSERERAEYRANTGVCNECHQMFDPFGIALEGFDAVGRVRTVDLEGRPIDTATTLPKMLDERRVTGAAEMASVIATSDAFAACMAMHFANFALATPSATVPSPDGPATGCEVRSIVDAFVTGGEPSFPGLVAEIARSRLLRLRERAAQ